MRIRKMVTLTLVLVSISAPLAGGFTAWLTATALSRVFPPAALAAAAVVVVEYFNWRAKLRRQILDDDRRDDELAATTA